MARKTKIETETQDNAGESTGPAEQQVEAKTRRPRRMARETSTEETSEVVAANIAEQPATAQPPSTASRTTSKIAQVIALLARAEGATLAELVETTGWQPHTTRAALTGLKKKGRTIAKDTRGETTCYRIEAAA